MHQTKAWQVLFLLGCISVLCTAPCYGGGKSEQNDHTQISEVQTYQFEHNVFPQDSPADNFVSELIFTGVSGKLTNRDDAIKAALEDAARRLSFFYSVNGYSIKWEYIGGKTQDFHVRSEYQLQYDTELEKFMGELKFNSMDVFENNNAVFVTARMVSTVHMPPFRGHSFGIERPDWVDKPPSVIDGYFVGVGFSGRLSSHRDTVVKSYENAVIEIIESMKSHVNWKHESYQNTSMSSGPFIVSSGTTVASGTLKNFYIIESWTDPVGLSVWTLAVASMSGDEK